MKNSILLCALILFTSCNDQVIQSHHSLKIGDSALTLPRLLDSPSPNASYSATEITYTQNRFVGLGMLKDKTLSIDAARETAEAQESEYEERNDGQFQIVLDTTQFLTIDEYVLPEDFYDNLTFEDRFNGGLERKLKQYPQNRYRSFPVFVINKSDSPNTLWIEDGSIAMIYEAVDRSGNWKPIEFKTYSWCGNSYWDLNLEKDQFALFKVPQQSGDFKTRLRLKARIGEQVFYSNEISGSIHTRQFDFNDSSEPYEWHYILDPESQASLFLDK